MTIAEIVRAKNEAAYSAAVACFSHRELDRQGHSVTFHFADRSTLTFKITYALVKEEVGA